MDGQRQAVREATWAWAPMSVYAPGQVQLLHRAQFPEPLGGLDDVPGWQFSVAGLLAAAAARAQEFQHALLAATCLGVGGARRLRFSGALRTQGLRVAGARVRHCVGDNVLLGALRLCTRRIHNTNINNKISMWGHRVDDGQGEVHGLRWQWRHHCHCALRRRRRGRWGRRLLSPAITTATGTTGTGRGLTTPRHG